MNLLDRLCVEHGLRVRGQYDAGHKTPDVYLVTNGDGDELVLKLGNDPKTVAEIAKNCTGYRRLREIGLSRIVPHLAAFEVGDEEAFILMEYCGDDFVIRARESTNPEGLYRDFTEAIEVIYRGSTHHSKTEERTIDLAYRQMVQQYNDHLQAVLDPKHTLLPLLEQVRTRVLFNGGFCCFASWDFTPRNVCMGPRGVKYIDPNEDVVGIPLVDLACFAGVVRDVEHLPASELGYESLKQLAVRVGGNLAIPEQQALRIFYLGRVLQCFLSSRFRIVSDIALARHFFDLAKSYLEVILSH